MSSSARILLTMAVAGALGGCEWIAGIEDTSVGVDAGQAVEDAATPGPADAATSGPADGGGIRPDAAVPNGCPEPCIDDAVAQFAYEQGGASGSWVYAEEAPGPLGNTYQEMVLGDQDGTLAWRGPAAAPATIVHCPSAPAYPGCAGVEDKLLLETSEPTVASPALVWIAPANGPGVYRLTGDWRVPPGAPENVPMTLLLVRNSQFDLVLDQRFATRTLPAAFDLEIDALAGDILRLIAIPDEPVPVAVSFYVSGARESGRCQMAALFDREIVGETLAFANLCEPSRAFQDSSDISSSCAAPAPLCPPTTDILLENGIRGHARAFVEGASIRYEGPPTRYAGDWTVQFWAYLDSQGSWTTETLLADHDCATEGGVGVRRYHLGAGTSELFFDVTYPDPARDRCADGPETVTATVSEDAWHFFRLTRSTSTQTLALCIDGLPVDDTFVPGDVDMSATEPMWLGRNVTYNPAYFRGSLADLRVFERSLPCSRP
jgi:hypothetical protein